MLQFKHLLYYFAMLVMAFAQSTPLPTTINAGSTSAVQTSYTLTDTSIVEATGSPPPVASTTIHVASTAASPTATASATAAATSATTLSVPALAGIAAGGAFLLIAAIILITFICIKRQRKAIDRWAELPDETIHRSTANPGSLRRPSSAATLVAAPAQAYVHSKGSMEHTPGTLNYSRSTKSSRSTILERISENAAKEFRFDFGVPPIVDTTPPLEQVRSNVAQVNEDTLQKLSLDKSLPSSPEHEIPMTALRLENYQAKTRPEESGRPRSSIYSTATGQAQRRETWGGAPVRESQNYF